MIPRHRAGDLFSLYNGEEQMKKSGFYIMKDEFFEDMKDPYLKRNKTGNRPHY